jgi:hypothetical protein
MGIHNNALIGASGQGGYFINNSLRFRSSASAYLNRTPASATNRQIWTYSTWLKRSDLTTGDATIISARADDNNRLFYSFGGGGAIDFFHNVSGTAYQVSTTALFRDPSAWYHFVIAVDTTQATAANRIKFYVNGVQLTLTVTTAGFPPQNTSTQWNNAVVHTIAKKDTAGVYSDCYLTEIYNIDGQQLTPSSFGETNVLTGVWQPKAYTGTYGTNGFYLKFADTSDNTAATIGKDSSGNGNNWTPNAISKTAGVTYDFMTDSPTVGPLASNYAVFNPLSSPGTFSNGNLNVSTSTTSATATTFFQSTGKWYWEVVCTSAVVTNTRFGVVNPNGVSTDLGGNANGWAYLGDGRVYHNGASASYGVSYATNDILMIALDIDAGKIWYGKNGTWMASGVPATGTSPSQSFTANQLMSPAVASGSGTFAYVLNCGQRPFSYTPPTGFVALNTQNLPATAIKNGALNMTTALWTANVANPTAGQKSIALGFQPDLVWSKNRNDAEHHYWVDSVRGDNSGSKWLKSNATAAEGADAVGSTTAKYVFTSTGFDIVDTDSNAGEVYYSTASRTYVGWAWKAGGTAVTNTSGTISSQVSANPTAGFSIVTYTGTGSAATIGHGLGVAPQMIIIFERSPGGDDHIVYHAGLTSNQYSIRLNTVAAQAGPSGAYWNSTSPISTVFSVGTSGESNQSTATYVAYCFASVAGYSAFGSFTGNGSADGPFVYLGFRPRFVMIRNPAISANWLIFDSSRDTSNQTVLFLFANSTGADTDSSGTVALDFVSNGFKIRQTSGNINGSGNALIYMAFAENPFKYSNAR